MSWIVRCDKRVVWEPGQVVGYLFLDTTRALERLVGTSSGVSERVDNYIDIDRPAFGRFLERSLDLLGQTSHGPLYAMTAGTVAVMIALSARINGQWPEVGERLASLAAQARTVMQPYHPPAAGDLG